MKDVFFTPMLKVARAALLRYYNQERPLGKIVVGKASAGRYKVILRSYDDEASVEVTDRKTGRSKTKIFNLKNIANYTDIIRSMAIF